jgi:hypothetical protein
MNKEEFIAYYQEEYGRREREQGAQDAVAARMTRAEVKGTSALNYSSLEDLIVANRAGYREKYLTLKEIERIYLIEKRDLVEGDGTKMWHEMHDDKIEVALVSLNKHLIDNPGEEIAHVRNRGKTIQVFRKNDQYAVFADGVERHPKCTPEDAIRALTTYMHDGS